MRVIPLRKNEKRPLEKNWPNRLYELDELSDWRGNIGLPTGEPNNIIAVDFDEKEPARQFFREHRDIIRTITVTRRGVHFWFEGRGPSTRFEHGDIQADGKLVVLPKSRIDDFEYRFAEGHVPQKLCPFPKELFLPQRKEVSTKIEANVDRLKMISRAMAYATTMEPCIEKSGSGADNGLYRFACKMVRQPPNGFGLTIEEAWPIALMFNSRCVPPWREDRFLRKLHEAAKLD